MSTSSANMWHCTNDLTHSPAAREALLPFPSPRMQHRHISVFPLTCVPMSRTAVMDNAGDGAAYLLTSVSDVGLQTYPKNRYQNRSTLSLTIKIESKIDRSLKIWNRHGTSMNSTLHINSTVYPKRNELTLYVLFKMMSSRLVTSTLSLQ